MIMHLEGKMRAPDRISKYRAECGRTDWSPKKQDDNQRRKKMTKHEDESTEKREHRIKQFLTTHGLLRRYMDGTASDKETRILSEWQPSELDGLFTKLSEQEEQEADGRIYQRVSKMIALQNGRKAKRSWHRVSRAIPVYLQSYAAVTFLFILMGLGIYMFQKEGVAHRQQTYLEQGGNPTFFRTGKNEIKEISLPDGSLVWLNANTTLSYEPVLFNKKQRVVRIESGEAFFEVVKDRKVPFVVQSNSFKTTVLGTSFNVNCDGEWISVTVETGKVHLAKTDQSAEVILEKGQQATFYPMAKNFEVNETATPLSGRWRENILSLNEIPLKDAFDKMEEWYKVKIECESPLLLSRTIRGTYTNEPLQKVLEDLAFMLDIQYEWVNDSTVIIR
jgi:ferric-dicitrate binding protein FerR (iron transport regulator)